MTEKSDSSGQKGLFSRLLSAFRGDSMTRDDFAVILENDQELFEPEEREMLAGVLEVAETHARDVMIPRSQMVVIEKQYSLSTMLDVIVESGHSRFPVTGEDRNEVLGILLAKDLLKFFQQNTDTEPNIEDFLRPVAVIPESKRLNALLREFRSGRNHMAVVVDEYGGISGLLTIEDVLEEIVGEIDDEHDAEEVEYIVADKTAPDDTERFLVRALTRIEDFDEHFESNLGSEDDYDTVGGLVMSEMGRLPRSGEFVEVQGFEFMVLRADRRRISMLRVRRLETPETEHDDE